MKPIALPGILALGLMASAFSSPADAAGCLKGAAVGGVAGHVAGHHGVVGAGAGCIIGHHEANKHARQNGAGQSAAPGAPASGSSTAPHAPPSSTSGSSTETKQPRPQSVYAMRSQGAGDDTGRPKSCFARMCGSGENRVYGRHWQPSGGLSGASRSRRSSVATISMFLEPHRLHTSRLALDG